ncbi:hypothetical protein LCGC14_2938290 [marine sediment metagenome]|uniref:Uncharacterized protein n=1 Tax=marine sediment metagenome TaxID=412755 RepID=A0A0F8ZRK7_9ZZZZ
MSYLELGCWFDMGDATCLLPDEHDGAHEPTPDNEIFIELVDKPTTDNPVSLRPDVTPVTPRAFQPRTMLLSVVLPIPWLIGVWHIVQWIF